MFFGYHSDDLKPHSHKPIVARCDGCCKYRILTNDSYNDLCPSCAIKGKKRPPRTKEWCNNMSISQKGRKKPPKSEETKRRSSATRQGIPYEEWNGYASRGGIYCEEFDEACKERIREKYNRLCYVCDKNEKNNGRKLDVHHVDMNKDQGCNGNEWKLVPLCKVCHGKSHYDPMRSRLQYLSLIY